VNNLTDIADRLDNYAVAGPSDLTGIADQLRAIDTQRPGYGGDACLICVIDAEGNIQLSSPAGYGRRQVAAFLELIGAKVNATCDADDVPELEEDQRPTVVPDDALTLNVE
jgi:hypothetical protein